MMNGIIERLTDFMQSEARSCSMDFGCVSPIYVYRMWNGLVSLEEIEKAMPVAIGRCMNNGTRNEGGA